MNTQRPRHWATAFGRGPHVLGLVALSSMLVAPPHAGAATPPLAPRTLKALRLLPIQHNGRHKPFDSFARELLRHITGTSRIGGQDPVLTVVSMIAHPEVWQARALIQVPFRPLREALGMNPKASGVSQQKLLATRTLMRMLPAIVEKQRRDEKLSMLEQEAMDVFDRFAAFSSLIEHRLELIPPPSPSEPSWRSVQQPEGYPPAQQAAIRDAWTSWVMALRADEASAVERTTADLLSILRGLNPAAYPPDWKLRAEVFYNHARPLWWAQMGYWVAALLLLWSLARASRSRRIVVAGLAVFGVSAAVHASGILLRVVIGGRPPVSNFFETMLWLPFAGVVMAAVFERIYRARYFALAASILAAITLLLSDSIPLDASISPVVAVLRSNLWLTVHVLTIVASYGALALATVLAHIYGVQFLVRHSRKEMASLDLFLYRTIQVGVVLLASGIMLGAVWANASWGRYWGWDPKETWALITLLWFIATLHGRMAGWLKGVGVALTTIGGFFLLLMTYYGVSFYLVGLHSYAGGHAKPLPPLLIIYCIAEVAFMTAVGLIAMTRKRLA